MFRGLLDQVDQAAPRGLAASQGAAQHDRLAGDHARHRVARLLAVRVHDPGHDLLVRTHVGGGDVLVRTDDVDDFRRESAGEALQFASGQVGRIDPDAALGPAEGQVDQRAFPRHPHGQGGDLSQVHVLVVAYAALGRTHGEEVLHAVSEDVLHEVVFVPPEGKRHDVGTLGEEQPLPDVLVEPHDLRRLQELLLGQFEHGRIPFAGARADTLDGIVDGPGEQGRVELGLHDVVLGARLHGRGGKGYVVQSGKDDDRHVRRGRPDAVEGVEVGAVRQDQVEQHHVEGYPADQVQAFPERSRHTKPGLQPAGLHEMTDRLHVYGVVFDHQDFDVVFRHGFLSRLPGFRGPTGTSARLPKGRSYLRTGIFR